jgi:hypothetical protein
MPHITKLATHRQGVEFRMLYIPVGCMRVPSVVTFR